VHAPLDAPRHPWAATDLLRTHRREGAQGASQAKMTKKDNQVSAKLDDAPIIRICRLVF
jgi:hypothetical protein